MPPSVKGTVVGTGAAVTGCCDQHDLWLSLTWLCAQIFSVVLLFTNEDINIAR
jgi:hypothetical protein